MNWKPKDLKRQQQHIILVFTPFWQIRNTLRDPTKPQKGNAIVHSKHASQVSSPFPVLLPITGLLVHCHLLYVAHNLTNFPNIIL
jgi:hypothetical protein